MKWYCRLFSLLYFSLDISIILIHWKNTHKLNQDKKNIVISMNDIRTNVEGPANAKESEILANTRLNTNRPRDR